MISVPLTASFNKVNSPSCQTPKVARKIFRSLASPASFPLISIIPPSALFKIDKSLQSIELRMKKKALFIDRDGTIIVEPPETYQVDTLEELEFLPKVIRNLYLREVK